MRQRTAPKSADVTHLTDDDDENNKKVLPAQRFKSRFIVGSLLFGIVVLIWEDHIHSYEINVTSSSSPVDLTEARYLAEQRKQAFSHPAEYEGTVGGSCRYNGHCPVGSTCSVAVGSELGVCEAICVQGPGAAAASTTRNACIQACQKELELDEHFYQEERPVVEWTEPVVRSAGRPLGCVLGYHRVAQGDKWKAREKNLNPPLLDEWMEQRFRYVIRVDPYQEHELYDNRWISYCFSPCESNTDCATENDQKGVASGFVCQDGACQRNPEYWDSAKDDQTHSDMVIVTGATNAYFKGLKNLVASARYWAPRHAIVVYNLGGLTSHHQLEILSWENVIALEWADGIPEQYPRHISQGQLYAWKPIIINETLTLYKTIFWLDAGSTLTGPIAPAEKIVKRNGVFLVKGQDLDMRLSSPRTYDWFNTTKTKLHTGPHFSGNTQAFLYPSRYYESVVRPNAKCALVVSCIAPVGSNLGNHRYDQTSLSILCYHPKIRAPHYTEYLAAMRTQLSRDLREPSTKFVWTSRQSTTSYTKIQGSYQGDGSSAYSEPAAIRINLGKVH